MVLDVISKILFFGCQRAMRCGRLKVVEKAANNNLPSTTQIGDKVLVVDSAGAPPLPIPNRVVKARSADDTWGATPWESRSPPGLCRQDDQHLDVRY